MTRASALLAACVLLMASLAGDARAAWSPATSMAAGRAGHTATLLADGQVLVLGGQGTVVPMPVERYDAASNRWMTAGSMPQQRFDHTATLLPDGRVLVVGGPPAAPSVSPALYDPRTGDWSAAGTMREAPSQHTATLLNDGRVLVAGGVSSKVLAGAELYDPATNSWSSAGTMATARLRAAAVRLADGRVLVVGGDGVATAEVYDPATNRWSPAGSLATGRRWHTATLLEDGRVLVTGGEGSVGSQSIGALSTAELYDPATNRWSPAADMGIAREHHTATLLPNGKVLVAGGDGPSPLASAELYDPVADRWRFAGNMATVRTQHTATLLADGRVLVAGGGGPFASLTTAELYSSGADTDGDGIDDSADACPTVAAATANGCPVDPDRIACTPPDLHLSDVAAAGRAKVALRGAADPRLVGRTVVLWRDGLALGVAPIGPTGTFSAQVAVPGRRATDRYQARVGAARSQRLKLARRMVDARLTRDNGTLTLSGRITPPFARRPAKIGLQRYLACRRRETVAVGDVRPDAEGRFSVRFPVPAAPGGVLMYRATTKVAARPGGRATRPSFTLPRPVDLR